MVFEVVLPSDLGFLLGSFGYCGFVGVVVGWFLLVCWGKKTVFGWGRF